jgi:hypothetical protein
MRKGTLRLVDTNLPGHLTFEVPPEGFSPMRASDDELRQYGLPHRPDPEKFPKEARLWARSMARIKTFVTPQLTPRPEAIHGAGLVHNNPTTNWSGLQVTAQSGIFTQIWGSWTIPEVRQPAGGSGVYYSAMWVGLNEGRSLFQAGTESDSSIFGNLGPFGPTSDTCYAWYEWFPGISVNINLPVLPGQAVGVNLEALSGGSEQGVVQMINYTTGVAITPIVVSPPTVDFNNNPINPPITGVQGLNAVWVIERTASPVNGVPVPGPLADFGIAGFQFGGAIDAAKSGTSLVTVGENDQGTLLNMIANDGVTVLSIAEERPGLVMFFTGGASA